jgi:hypothetical protein
VGSPNLDQALPGDLDLNRCRIAEALIERLPGIGISDESPAIRKLLLRYGRFGDDTSGTKKSTERLCADVVSLKQS